MDKDLIQHAVLVPSIAASERDSALGEMLDAVVAAGQLDGGERERVAKELVLRESQGSTGLGNGVAVPHVKATVVEGLVIAVGINQDGLGFDAIDGRPVHIVFVVLGPEGGVPERHLGVLRWVSTLARNADFRRFALGCSSADDLRDLLLEMTEA